MKKLPLLIAISLLSINLIVAQNNINTVVLDSDGNKLLPYSKGKVTVKDIYPDNSSSSTAKLYIEKLNNFTNALKQTNLLNPPFGFEISLSKWIADITDYSTSKPRDIITASLEATLSPICKIDEAPTVDWRIHSGFYIFMNNPTKLAGSPIISDIYPCPRKIADFYSYPIYSTTNGEITIINYTNKPIFLPVSQEEYINTLIADLEKKIKNDTKDKTKYKEDVDNLTGNEQKKQQQEEFERAYNELLKYDKKAAEEFKKSIQEANKALEASSDDLNVANEAYDNSIAIHKSNIEKLRSELAGMSTVERKRQAYYALEASENSNLLPESRKDLGEALVKINPQLVDFNSSKLQIICIEWNLSNNSIKDKPRYYKTSNNSDSFIDSKTYQIYQDAEFWKNVLQSLGK